MEISPTNNEPSKTGKMIIDIYEAPTIKAGTTFIPEPPKLFGIPMPKNTHTPINETIETNGITTFTGKESGIR